VISSAGV